MSRSTLRRAARCGRLEGIACALAELGSPATAIARRAAAQLAAQLDAEELAADVRIRLADGPRYPAPAAPPDTWTESGTRLTRRM